MGKRKSRTKRKAVHYKAQSVANVSLAPLGGDHGTGTRAAMAGKEVRPIRDTNGNNPNNIGRVEAINVLAGLSFLSMRQFQAGEEIQLAWLGVEKISSGGELKEQVDSTPKPDAAMAIQIDAQSRLVNAMSAVPSDMRGIVEHVCWHNLPLKKQSKRSKYFERQSELQVALDLVANKLRY